VGWAIKERERRVKERLCLSYIKKSPSLVREGDTGGELPSKCLRE
jgi:hypothetical protein